MAGDILFYQFSRSRIERCDFNHFLDLYAPLKLPTAGKLHEMMGTFLFGVEGYDHDPREVHSIPEIRRFYMQFHKAWPYWLYFGNLETESLRMIILCCLPSINAVKVDNKPDVAVNYDRLELLHFIASDFGPMNAMCDRAGMTERLIYERTKAVFDYFALPFDAEPPPE